MYPQTSTHLDPSSLSGQSVSVSTSVLPWAMLDWITEGTPERTLQWGMCPWSRRRAPWLPLRGSICREARRQLNVARKIRIPPWMRITSRNHQSSIDPGIEQEACLPSPNSGCGHGWNNTSSTSTRTDVNPSWGPDLTVAAPSQYNEEASWTQMPSKDGEVWRVNLYSMFTDTYPQRKSWIRDDRVILYWRMISFPLSAEMEIQELSWDRL